MNQKTDKFYFCIFVNVDHPGLSVGNSSEFSIRFAHSNSIRIIEPQGLQDFCQCREYIIIYSMYIATTLTKIVSRGGICIFYIGILMEYFCQW